MAKKKFKSKVVIQDAGRTLDLTQVSISDLLHSEEVQQLKEQVERSFDMSRYPDPVFYVGEDQIKIIQMEKSRLSLDLGTRKYNDLIKWGARLSDSDIRLHDSRKIGLCCSQFERCTFVAIQPQVELRLISVHLTDCRFKGVFNDCAFGVKSEARCFHEPLATVRRCDFSKAELNACEFLDVDFSQVTWPEKPHIIVREPWRNVDAIQAIQSNGSLHTFLASLASSTEDVCAKAYSVNWITAQDWAARQFTLDHFLAACRMLDFVTINI